MTQFVGCIDLHNGEVKQIVGGSLTTKSEELKTNYVAEHPSSYFANLYRKNDVYGAHVIKLGPKNDAAAEEALNAWPDYLQIGGGINAENALEWLQKGASKVIVTSYLFPGGDLDRERLHLLEKAVGKDKLVIDLSCRRVLRGTEESHSSTSPEWVVAMDKWQRLTSFKLSKEALTELAEHCSEFLVHAADVEGLCQGVDEELVAKLAEWSPIKVVYAGGGRSLDDLELVKTLSRGKVDLTFGSALDIFGGSGVKFDEAVKWNKNNK